MILSASSNAQQLCGQVRNVGNVGDLYPIEAKPHYLGCFVPGRVGRREGGLREGAMLLDEKAPSVEMHKERSEHGTTW